MIDDLKTVCANFGLGNASSEYKIITEIFLYKFFYLTSLEHFVALFRKFIQKLGIVVFRISIF